MNTIALDKQRKAWQVAEANQAIPHNSTEKQIERLQDEARAKNAAADLLVKIKALLEEARYNVKDISLTITDTSVKVKFG